MNFKEYEQKRNTLTDQFIEKIDPLRRQENIEEWKKVRSIYSEEIQALRNEWLKSSLKADQKVRQ